MNAITQDQTILKTRVRKFVKNIEHKMNTFGANCKLNSNLRVHEGIHYTVVLFRPVSEIEYAPIAVLETDTILDKPKDAYNEITSQIFAALKKLSKKAA